LIFRPDAKNCLRLLSNLGGDINILDSYLNTPEFQEILSEIPGIKLALNSVGGKIVSDISRILSPNATIVTYGGLSKHNINISPDLFAYKQLSLKGFWMLDWNRTHTLAERKAMIDEVTDLIMKRKLIFFFEAHDFDDFNYALEKSMEPYRLRKVILNMDYPDRLKEHDQKSEKLISDIFSGPAY